MNEQEQETPEPWEVTALPYEDGCGFIIEDAVGHRLATAPTEEIADRIAAIPAMLRALEVLRSGGAQGQLAFLHERGLKAPETRYGDSQKPETYQITNDHEMDADGIYPACDSLARAVTRAAIAQAEQGAARRGPCANCGGQPAEHRARLGDGAWCACSEDCQCDGYVAETGAAG